MPAWIHDRAMKLKRKMEDTYGPEKAKQVAFAVATQQAHATGKSPKTFVSKQTGERERFGTSEGRREAKAKMDKPKSEYKKTASLIMFDGFADELQKIALVTSRAVMKTIVKGKPLSRYQSMGWPMRSSVSKLRMSSEPVAPWVGERLRARAQYPDVPMKAARA